MAELGLCEELKLAPGLARKMRVLSVHELARYQYLRCVGCHFPDSPRLNDFNDWVAKRGRWAGVECLKALAYAISPRDV